MSAVGPSAEPADAFRAITGCRELLADVGGVPGSRLAADVVASCAALGAEGRGALFDALAHEFSLDIPALRHAAEGYVNAPSDAAVQALRRASEAPRQAIFLRLAAARGGTGLLVRMREFLIDGRRDHPSWEAVEADVTEVLKPIFNRGLLEFQRIEWDTPAPILEKLMQHEAVHAIHDWREMRRRLDADRRCYALFHPAWPDEPLIFTEVALTAGMSAKVDAILDPDALLLDAERCDSAILYSISSCQPGLRGFALGNDLIGRVADELRVQLPWLKTIATMSPIPGFRRWLARLSGPFEQGSAVQDAVAAASSREWATEAAEAARLGSYLLPLCAHYLLHVKEGGEPADPVARFHLANGARLKRLNVMSDLSRAGMDRALGLTANYVYYPVNLARSCIAYRQEHRVSTTRQLEWLARRGAELCGASGTELPISA